MMLVWKLFCNKAYQGQYFYGDRFIWDLNFLSGYKPNNSISYGFFFKCTTVGQDSDWMTTLT